MSKSDNLKVNNRWKMDSKERRSFDQRKKKRENISNRSKFDMIKIEDKKIEDKKREELNMLNEESFPELVKAVPIGNGKNDYLEKIKKQKELDEVKVKLKPGWVAYRKRKENNKIQVSRDGVNFYDSLKETYTDEEWQRKEKEEFDREMTIISYRLNELYLKRKRESEDYYNETGELDSFAEAELDRIEYEKYVKKFDEEALEMEESSEDEYSEEEGYDSDNRYKYR